VKKTSGVFLPVGTGVALAWGKDRNTVSHLFTILGPLLIAVGLIGSIRDLTGRNDRRF
jgi:hypothetical protein